MSGERGQTVLVVSHYYGAHGGGVERVAGRLIQEMAAQGPHRFVWAASDLEPCATCPGVTPLPMRASNALERWVGVPWPIWSWDSLKRLKQAVAQSQVVWLHDTLYLGNMVAYFWARRMGKPVIVTQHIGLIPYRNPVLRWVMRVADKAVTQPTLRAAAQTLFVSDRVANEYYRKVSFQRSVKIVPNGVDAKVFHMPMAEKRRYLRQRFALKNEQPVLLFVGRFVEKKGLSVIRHLAQMLPDWRFWLAGRGPIQPSKWLLPNVHVFEDREGETLAELYQAADLLVLPSYGEGFPLVVQEAMACGLPVMCGPQTAAGSQIARPLLCVARVWPEDPYKTAQAFAEKLKSVSLPLAHPYHELADFAQTHWDWRAVAQAYGEAFQEALN